MPPRTSTHRFDDLDIDEDILCEAMNEASQEASAASRFAAALPAIGIIGMIVATQIEPIPTILAASVIAALALLMLFMLAFGRQRHYRGVRAALNRRGFHLCIECGYSLEGLDPRLAACPECGTPPDSAAPPMSDQNQRGGDDASPPRDH